MSRWATTALLVMLVGVTSVRAEDKKEEAVKKPVGAWTRTVDDTTITFAFKADNTLKIILKLSDGMMELDTDYGMSKDSYVFGRITKVKPDGGNGPAAGDLFSFKIKADKTTLTISDLTTSKGSDDNAKKLVEGEYKVEKPK